MELKKFLGAALAAMFLAGGFSAAALAQGGMMSSSMQDPMVGGAAMSPEKNIVQNAANSKDHTTLVALVKQAGLVQTLEGPGPFTVFAPTNEAFAKLPKATVEKVSGREMQQSEHRSSTLQRADEAEQGCLPNIS